MTATGHDERAARIRENLRRKSERVVERHTQEIPPQVAEALLQMVARVTAIEEGFAELAAQASAANLRAIDMENRLAQVEAVHRVLADEARKRVA